MSAKNVNNKGSKSLSSNFKSHLEGSTIVLLKMNMDIILMMHKIEKEKVEDPNNTNYTNKN